MANKRYEMTDEQWEQIKESIPIAKTGRPPKDNRLMFNALLWRVKVELVGKICPKDTLRGKQFTQDFVNGVMTARYKLFFKS